jgi:hypothetical protein
MMSAHSDKIAHQMMLTGAAIGLCGMISALTAQWAYGAQLTKSDRMASPLTKEVRNYDRPRINGNRIAFCLPADGACGKPAADAFCRDKDFEGVLTFQRERMEGHGAQMRFLRIKCWRSVGATAPAVADVNVISNTSTKSNRLRFGSRGDWK